jgi:hypothetical protein
MKTLLILVLLQFTYTCFAADVQITIQHTKSDTLYATLKYDEATLSSKRFTLTRINGVFKFSHPVSEPTELLIYDGQNVIMGIVENADKVDISYDFTNPYNSYNINGRGEKKYSLKKQFPSNELKVIIQDANTFNLLNKFE